MANKKKIDLNKRMLPSTIGKEKLIVKTFEIRELTDNSGEVNESTFIQISFEGILINLSVAAAMKLGNELRKQLGIK